MLIQNATDIGLIIRERRRTLGLGQEELARRVKVSRQWLVEIEKGKPRAEIGLILRTLGALGLELHIGTSIPPETRVPSANVIPTVDIDELLADLAKDPS
ncbi:transcriptional regulator [Skermanella stibiiresistens SB22]|uniref:Transcriptional regulator n=1 Tax=Skermanella stibiiresistens SB22 TaxID=1385369 RepID=W9HCH2_9PROT|nr:helix-turn-helix domain-containing protein [Skermanella stibiiresistens]EWY42407.1 transcriptional regulator [Skermanella stibiiresistens SB22]